MSDLGWAVKNGDLEKVKEFIENKVNSLGIKITIGISVLKLSFVLYRVAYLWEDVCICLHSKV